MLWGAQSFSTMKSCLPSTLSNGYMKRVRFSSGTQSKVSHPWHPGTSGAQLSSGYLFANKLHMLDIILHQATVLDVGKSCHCFKRLLYLIDLCCSLASNSKVEQIPATLGANYYKNDKNKEPHGRVWNEKTTLIPKN